MHSPMEQFEIKPLLHLNLFGIDALHEFIDLDDHRRDPGDGGVRVGHAPARAGAGPPAVGRRVGLRVHRRHGARQRRRRRQEVLPVHPDALHLHPVLRRAGHGALLVHADQPHRRHLRDGRLRVRGRHHHRLRQARPALPVAVRAEGRAVRAAAAAGRSTSSPLPSARSACRSDCSPTCWRATPC